MTDARARVTGHALDRTDAAWAGLEFTYVFFGLALPPLADVRRALAMVMEVDPLIGSRIDLVRGTYHPVEAAYVQRRTRELVTDGVPPGLRPETALDNLDVDLGDAPFRLLVGQGELAVCWSHALGDAWSCFTFIKHLLEQARTPHRLPLTWDSIASRRRDLLVAWSVIRRPGSVVRAVRRREEFSGGRYELASLRTSGERHHTSLSTSDADFLTDLARSRARRGVRTTTASIVLTGLRKHVAHRLATPVPGAEIIFDTRSLSAETHRAFGNWVAGVYVRPDDDGSVESVAAAAKEIRQRGYPFIAAAAARRRARPRSAADRMVLAPQGRPQLTLTFLNRGGPQQGYLWHPDRQHFLVGSGPPNGLDTLMIGGREREGRLDLSLDHYPSHWDTEAVQQVIEDFFADPWGDSVPPVPGGAR